MATSSPPSAPISFASSSKIDEDIVMGTSFTPTARGILSFGTPGSWRRTMRVGSFGSTFYPGVSPGQLLGPLDPNDFKPASLESDHASLFHAFKAGSLPREDELCRNYTCCGLPLPDLHALVEHFEEAHVIVVDPYAQQLAQQQQSSSPPSNQPQDPSAGNLTQQEPVPSASGNLASAVTPSPFSPSATTSSASFATHAGPSTSTPHDSTSSSAVSTPSPPPAPANSPVTDSYGEELEMEMELDFDSGSSGASSPAPPSTPSHAPFLNGNHHAHSHHRHMLNGMNGGMSHSSHTTAMYIPADPAHPAYPDPGPGERAPVPAFDTTAVLPPHVAARFASELHGRLSMFPSMPPMPSTSHHHLPQHYNNPASSSLAMALGNPTLQTTLHHAQNAPHQRPMVPVHHFAQAFHSASATAPAVRAEDAFNAYAGYSDWSSSMPGTVPTTPASEEFPHAGYHSDLSGSGAITPALLTSAAPTPATSRVPSPVPASPTTASTSSACAGTNGAGLSRSSSTCSKSTSAAESLVRASSSFLLSKPFRCPKPNCNKSYKQANGLKYHLTHGSCSFAPPKDVEHLKALLERKKAAKAALAASGVSVEGSSAPSTPGLDVDMNADPLELSEREVREAEREAERALRPFACGVGDCGRRYKNMNGLRYHYAHSGEHGAIGLALLASGQHESLPGVKRGSSGVSSQGHSVSGSTNASRSQSRSASAANSRVGTPVLDHPPSPLSAGSTASTQPPLQISLNGTNGFSHGSSLAMHAPTPSTPSVAAPTQVAAQGTFFSTTQYAAMHQQQIAAQQQAQHHQHHQHAFQVSQPSPMRMHFQQTQQPQYSAATGYFS